MGGWLLVALGVLGRADVWHLKTGEVVAGKLVKEEAQSVTVESLALGRIKVPRDQIERWERSELSSPEPKAASAPPPKAESSPAKSSATKPSAAPAATAKKIDWPPTDGFDWLELKSGEWLRGRVKSIQNKKVEFDSDELDDQSFELKDIRRLISPNPNFLMFHDRSTAVGTVELSPEQVVVKGKQSVTRPRGQLRGLTPGHPKEANYWSGKLSFGLSIRSGNTEQVDATVKGGVQRRTPATRFSFDYLGNFARLHGETSANNHRVNTAYDLSLTERVYLRPVFGQLYRDPFQNLSYQATVGLGAGYLIRDTRRTEWEVFGGPAYQFTRFETIEAGGDLTDGTPAFVLGSKFDTELTRRIDLLLSYQGIATSPEAGTLTLHLVHTLEVELTKVLDLDITFIWDRIQTPQTDTDGHTPKQDDLRLNVGVSLDF